MNTSTDTVSGELDLIHEAKIQIADGIREVIMADVLAGKYNEYELLGRLGKTAVGITAFKSRKTWTLDYAIVIAKKLGYALGAVAVAHEPEQQGLPEINPKDKSWIDILNKQNNLTRQGKKETLI